MEQETIKQLKKSAIVGAVFLILVIVIELLIVFGCEGGLGCLSLSFLIALPTSLLNIVFASFFGYIFSILFYFVVGTLIGFIMIKLFSKRV